MSNNPFELSFFSVEDFPPFDFSIAVALTYSDNLRKLWWSGCSGVSHRFAKLDLRRGDY